jgi:hypothetical protein
MLRRLITRFLLTLVPLIVFVLGLKWHVDTCVWSHGNQIFHRLPAAPASTCDRLKVWDEESHSSEERSRGGLFVLGTKGSSSSAFVMHYFSSRFAELKLPLLLIERAPLSLSALVVLTWGVLLAAMLAAVIWESASMIGNGIRASLSPVDLNALDQELHPVRRRLTATIQLIGWRADQLKKHKPLPPLPSLSRKEPSKKLTR